MPKRVCPFCGALNDRTDPTCFSCQQSLPRLRAPRVAQKEKEIDDRKPKKEPKIASQMALPLTLETEETPGPLQTPPDNQQQSSPSKRAVIPDRACPFCGYLNNWAAGFCSSCSRSIPPLKPAAPVRTEKPVITRAPAPTRPATPAPKPTPAPPPIPLPVPVAVPAPVPVPTDDLPITQPAKQPKEQNEPKEPLRISRGRCLSCGSLLLSSFVCVKCGAKVDLSAPLAEPATQTIGPSYLSKLVGFFLLGLIFGLLGTQAVERFRCVGWHWSTPPAEKPADAGK